MVATESIIDIEGAVSSKTDGMYFPIQFLIMSLFGSKCQSISKGSHTYKEITSI